MAETIICCLNAGNYLGRGKEYVEILFDRVWANISDKTEFQFHCFTDDAEPYAAGITKRPLLPYLKGWWHKLYLFAPDVFKEGDRVIFFDLDTIITGALDEILKYDGAFATLRDFWRPQGLGPAIMLWTPTKDTEYFWTYFKQRWAFGIREDYLGALGGRGDQAILEEIRMLATKTTAKDGKIIEETWLTNPLQTLDYLQDKFPKKFVSYKDEARFELPKGAKVVCFHGKPRPHQVKAGWVPQLWKIGAGSAVELEIVGNVEDSIIEDNINYAYTLQHEMLANQYMKPHDSELCIVGGGPSLKNRLFELKLKQEAGCVLWALNGTFNYLINNGITPDALVILDGRPENADFIPDAATTLLLASQCAPSLFKKAETTGSKIIIWNSYLTGMEKLLDKRKAALISCGSTVGLNALALAQCFGFKSLHLFGYDSSYEGDENHAYQQPLNNGERVLEATCDGLTFKCAPWMVTQVEEFKDRAPNLIKQGMQFHFHCEGLLPYVASLISKENVAINQSNDINNT